MTEEPKIQKEQQLTTNPFQFGISQIMLWTVITAVVVACLMYLPVAIYVVILLAFICVPLGPFVILFVTIAFSPEKRGYLSLNHGPTKILVAAWFTCAAIALSTCLLVYWGMLY